MDPSGPPGCWTHRRGTPRRWRGEAEAEHSCVEQDTAVGEHERATVRRKDILEVSRCLTSMAFNEAHSTGRKLKASAYVESDIDVLQLDEPQR